jgi:hypothetical protein
MKLKYGRKIRTEDNRQLEIKSIQESIKDHHILFIDLNSRRRRLVYSQGIERDAMLSLIYEKCKLVSLEDDH